MIELLVRGPSGERRARFDADEITLGRSIEAGVRIVSPYVARRHAAILEIDGRLFARDNGSTNGTSVNGEALTAQPRRIDLGDTIELPSFFGETRVVDHSVEVLAHAPLIDPDFEAREATYLLPLGANPDDEAVRGVYMDVLEERGEVLRAAWLRAEIAARRSGGDESFVRALDELTRSLRAAPRWRMLVSRARVERCNDARCPSLWNALPSRAAEPGAWDRSRRCEACGANVLYCDEIDQARYHREVDTTTLIAIDRIAARQRYASQTTVTPSPPSSLVPGRNRAT